MNNICTESPVALMDLDPEVDWLRETFDTEGEAKGFAYGLTWGDEPQWSVDAVELCRFHNKWDVVFAHIDDVAPGLR